MPRAIWKGAITFGLVHVPVGVYPAATSEGLDFDWLDERDLSPVGYKRVNKSTGREVPREKIVKGLEHAKGQYVVISDKEIKSANVKATQTIDIVAFVETDAVGPAWFDTPYFLAPDKRGEKVYSLLRETLRKEDKVGIAYVVLHTKQHLAMLRVEGNALMMITLRWASEMREATGLGLPTARPSLRPNELKMAAQLVKDMTEPWKPEKYKDRFRADILALVKKKVAKGQVAEVAEPKGDQPAAASNVVDLMALLKESLAKKKPAGSRKRAA
ncbi:Ku protein [Usitatibacter palustris]|uniref:Non-homologous end joining protein Ku n=1 Tax=Usitatibacter palustris TaxID=2732487 RepID=A0A6M4H9R8_9PROT|nr:Ku protein [Usitatibacter palustris]QJR15463.1 Non-homologous end joining protein Ku [Usitatibacter palustris]